MENVKQLNEKRPKTYVYIDGFNLYYGALNKRGQGRKWLNLNLWLSKLLNGNEIIKIKFFTARVTGKFDQDKPLRQNFYLRALKTLPNIEIMEGAFINKNIKIQINQDISLSGVVPEEKGTDVNLATHLVNDAHNKKFDVAVVVSNDSDLSEAIRIVNQELRIPVGIINPCMNRSFNKQITNYSSFKRQTRDSPILSSQFPMELNDSLGVFTKPPTW